MIDVDYLVKFNICVLEV